MQNYTEITENTTIEDSRELLLDNDKTIASHYSGTAFPTENLVIGMECYRTDEDIKYRLTSLNPVAWKQVGELNGSPTAPTPDDSNTKCIANVEYVRSAIAELIGSSPDALDTLYELAYALGNDPNFATTVTNALAGKAPISHTHTKAQVGLGNVDNTRDADKTVKGATTATNVSGNGTVSANAITSMSGELEARGTSSKLPQVLLHIPNVNYSRFRMSADGVIHAQNGGNDNYVNMRAANFIGNLSGNAASAGCVNTLGRKAAAELPSTYPEGISSHQVYNNGYPCAYGNTLTVIGVARSATQFCMEWSGTTGGKGRIWIRNARDNTNTWSEWSQLAGDWQGHVDTSNFLNSSTRLLYGWNGLNYFNANMSAGNAANSNVGPVGGWSHIIRMNHANPAGFFTDIAAPLNDLSLYYRQVRGGGVLGWFKLCDSNNAAEFTVGNANKLIGKNWYWSGQNGQPAWLWGGSDGTNMYVYNPSNFRVANANTVADLGINGTVNNGANKIVRTQGNGYTMFGYINSNVGVENGNVTNVIYDNGDGYYRKCSLAHLASKINVAGGNGGRGSKTFTSSGTFTVPAGVTNVYITATAGGGGGSGSLGIGPCSGGKGARVCRRRIAVTPGTNYTVTIGAGGAGVSWYGTAGAGGVTSFGAALSLTGGGGGVGSDTEGRTRDGTSPAPQDVIIQHNLMGYGAAGAGSRNTAGGSGKAGVLHIEW